MNQFIQMSDILPYSKTTEGDALITESFIIKKTGNVYSKPILFTAMVSYEGEQAPTIEFHIFASDKTRFYTSHVYNLGVRNDFAIKQWRVPPLMFSDATLVVKVEVPEGTVLKVRSFGADYDSNIKDWNGGLRHNAHLGFLGMITPNTMASYEIAALCGFPACIVNPRKTADGVFVCMHNPTINDTARDENGQRPEEDLPIDQLNYDDLAKWDVGVSRNHIWKGLRIPKLDDFFAMCSRTGMRPMFSTHPIFTIDEWKQIKAMLIRHGILRNLHIKSFDLDNLKNAYTVFGTEIDGYTWDRVEFADEDLASLVNAGIDKTKCRLGMEIAFKNCTQESTEKIIKEGLFAAVWAVKKRTADEYESVISWGVTEFTEDYHCSMGLNW